MIRVWRRLARAVIGEVDRVVADRVADTTKPDLATGATAGVQHAGLVVEAEEG